MGDPEPNSIILDRECGTTCTVNLLGATITSWKVAGNEQLFVSKNAVIDGKIPIAGGIPIVFPKFSHWEGKPFHGFAKEAQWFVESPATTTETGDVKAVLGLTDSDWSREIWNYAFSLTLEVVLGRTQLTMDVSVHNLSLQHSFGFELLLHTYFLLPDVTKCEITGFKGCSYLDNTQNLQEFTQETDAITVLKHTDNIYKDTDEKHIISHTSGGKSIKLRKSNFPDTVVWNPWDSPEAQHFLCVEVGHVTQPVLLAPAQTFKASQVIQVT